MATIAHGFQVSFVGALRIIAEMRCGEHDLALCPLRRLRMSLFATPRAGIGAMQATFALTFTTTPSPVKPYTIGNRTPVGMII